MPYQKDVQERQWWWCPKWYWPFAVCSGIRTQHKWCYSFSWVDITIYGVVAHYEGCENGRLYTWTRPGLGIGSGEGRIGEWCFDDSLGGDEGRCDPSNTGRAAQGLSASDPYASDIDYDVKTLKSTIAETGTFDFTGENSRICQDGLWPWKRTLHEEVITAFVITRFGTIQWYLGGIPILNNSGTLMIGCLCHWPFPLPKGRSQNRTVHVKYDITTEANKSTIRIFNDPLDGSYSLSIGMRALDNGREYSSYYTSANFHGETCDFEEKQVQAMLKCLVRIRDLRVIEKPSFKKPTPDPVIVFSEEIKKYTRPENRETVAVLRDIAQNSLTDDPKMLTEVIDQLEQHIGLAGISRLMSIESSTQKTENCGCGKSVISGKPLAAALITLGIGALGWVVASRLLRGCRGAGHQDNRRLDS